MSTPGHVPLMSEPSEGTERDEVGTPRKFTCCLGAVWSNGFNALSEVGRIREAFEGGFFEEAGSEGLVEFESIERRKDTSRHQLEE